MTSCPIAGSWNPALGRHSMTQACWMPALTRLPEEKEGFQARLCGGIAGCRAGRRGPCALACIHRSRSRAAQREWPHLLARGTRFGRPSRGGRDECWPVRRRMRSCEDARACCNVIWLLSGLGKRVA
jgi:hypothetical protein